MGHGFHSYGKKCMTNGVFGQQATCGSRQIHENSAVFTPFAELGTGSMEHLITVLSLGKVLALSLIVDFWEQISSDRKSEMPLE